MTRATSSSTQLLSRIVEALPFPVAAAAADGRIYAANPAWKRLAQGAGNAQAGLADLFPQAVAAAQEILRGASLVRRQALPLSGGSPSGSPSGSEGVSTWYDLDLVPHPDIPAVVLITAHDVTERVMAGQKVEAAREARQTATRMAASLQAQVAERTHALTEAALALQAEMRRRQDIQAALLQSQKLEALGQLTAGVAHDFSNVLTAIKGSFELIQRHTQEPKLLNLVMRGRNAVVRATALTRQLLDFGRGESTTPSVLDVEAVLGRADDLIAHALGRNIHRSREIQQDCWPVLIDGHQLEVALLNLAINARDAMPDGGTLVVSARNLTADERPGMLPVNDYVSIWVRDSGHGMPPDVLARATEPFFTTKNEGKGTGLGLPMVHAFALRSSGCLRIDSREGAGTVVQIILPRASVTGMETDEPGNYTPVSNAPASAPKQRPSTIMVVEDDDQVRRITARYLCRRGYDVIEAPNAEFALALSHSIEHLDLLVTDVAMPGLKGPVLAARLRAERPDLPVLFITGDAGCDSLETEHVLLKPFTGADLIRAIGHRIGQKQDRETADGGVIRRLKNPALVAS